MLVKDIDFKIPSVANSTGAVFQNPMTQLNTADPTIIYDDVRQVWYAVTTGDKTILLHRAKTFEKLFHEEEKIIYEARDEDGVYGYIWAPELHFVDGHWYIYTSTHEKDNNNRKHLTVYSAKTDDPWDGFDFAAHINPSVFAIDPTVARLSINGKLYICFSYVRGQQLIAIQEMKSPTEVVGEFSVIAQATYPWELVPPNDTNKINEGAFFVENQGRTFIVYCGNGCWNNDYVFGILELVGDDPLNPDHWVKDEVPLFTKGNGCYGPGHGTFFYSPDKSELWIAYHCLHEFNPDNSPMVRHCNAQRVYFDSTGFPHIGLPTERNVNIPVPSNK
ncbi:MAG: family 43 glycosylhydrolase [Clostridia bacterium]|nr:family 43 glycosylhydrolase [Clostridia bacterium]